MPDRRIVCIACSVLKREIEHLVCRYGYDMETEYLDSSYHLHPGDLADELTMLLEKARSGGKTIMLIFGDCHAYMHDMEIPETVWRTPTANCAGILLGDDDQKRFLREGCLFLFPEWLDRHAWRDFFPGQLGDPGSEVTSFVRDSFRKLVYLDTGLIDVPHEILGECSTVIGLPVEVHTTSLEILRLRIEEGLQQLQDISIA